MASRIRKDDDVVVISGGSKGERGKVLEMRGDRVLVSGINVIKRHQKPTQLQAGGIIEKEAPIHVSNVMLIDSKSDKPTRVKAGTNKDGKKVRVAVKTGTVIG